MQGSRSHITLNVDDLGTYTFLFYANERGLLNMVSEKKRYVPSLSMLSFLFFVGHLACPSDDGLLALISPMVIMAITRVKVQISLSSLMHLACYYSLFNELKALAILCTFNAIASVKGKQLKASPAALNLINFRKKWSCYSFRSMKHRKGFPPLPLRYASSFSHTWYGSDS